MRMENEDKVKLKDMYEFYMQNNKDKKKSHMEYEIRLPEKKK